MSMHDHSGHQGDPQGSFLTSRPGLVLIGFLAIAGVLLFTEHRAHILGALFWLLPFACLFMHMFMHGGHGGREDHGRCDERNVS
jgi:hypothetical protein